MSAKEPPAPVYVFGRFNWNIDAAVSSSLNEGMKWANLLGVFPEISVIVFFITKFCIKKSGFRESYYIIYTMGCIVDAIPKILNFLSTYLIVRNQVLWGLSAFFNWYNSNYMSLWILILAVNRFTAIFWSLDYNTIWTKRNTTIVSVFLSVYPFIIHCFNPVNTWCQMIGSLCPISLRMTARVTEFEIYYGYISDSAFEILGAVLCAASAIRILVKKQMQNLNVEKILLVQAFTSSVFLLLSTASSWTSSVTLPSANETVSMPEKLRLQSLQRFLLAFSDCFFNIHHLVGMLLLVCFSRTVRTAYVQFYKLDKVRDRIRKPKNKIRTVQVQPAGTKTTEPTKGPSHIQTTRHR